MDTPALFLMPSSQGINTTITSKNAGEKLWIRVERQTLPRLQQSGDILFTIRTYVYALNCLEDDPPMADNLAQAVLQMLPNLQSYKNLLPIRDVLIGYLHHIAAV